MTRGYAVYTENGKNASDVVYLGSSAYPAYYGLQLLEVIESGKSLKALADESDPELRPLPDYDAAVQAKGVVSEELQNEWGVDFVYVYNTTTKVLTVWERGSLLCKFDLNAKMAACRAFFEYDYLLEESISTDPLTLFCSSKGVDKAMRKIADEIKAKDDVLMRVLGGPHANISQGHKLVTGRTFNGYTKFEWRYTISHLMETDSGWEFKPTYVVSLEPGWGQPEDEPKRFIAYIGTYKDQGGSPFGKLRLPTPVQKDGRSDMSKRAAEKFISQWVGLNMDAILTYQQVFDAVRATNKKLKDIEDTEGITYNEIGVRGRAAIYKCIQEIKPIIGAMECIPKPFWSVDEIQKRMRLNLSYMIERAAMERPDKPNNI